MPLNPEQQRALVSRLTAACGGAYTPEQRRKHFITGPQWAAAYDGNAIFHAPTRKPVHFETVIEKFAEIGIGYWTTHDTDVLPYDALGNAKQDEIIGQIGAALKKHGLKCSMVTTETFHNAVFAGGPAGEQPEVRNYAKWRLENTVGIGHELGASYVVYWPGSLGYQFQGIVDEVQSLKWFAEGINAACEADIAIAAKKGQPTMKHCMEAKPFEPQAEILLPTSDAMLAWIFSGQLTHPEMVGLNPEYLHELMWGGAVRSSLARALLCGKLFHFDINDGYRLKHDVDIAVGLVNPLDWLNVLVLLRTYDYNGPFNLDFKPPRTTSNDGVFDISFPTAVDRFITLWEMAGEVMTDPILSEASKALKEGAGVAAGADANAIFEANKELWSLHELMAHRLFQILVGQHKGRIFSS
ncbi:sugar phosphate isomerase/epimerase family protein [Bryobacter aggregatus]|uniref:sugar phosphate isomerase/epimerase family protein n=1 Tax=Bryobacter aggregatus TaxID=360054 RepID=UPI0004E27E2E|nr:TIM barrel protein [Bryobacter aggregatus]